MADNIRDVYSVVFESLGEQKLVQDLNKINAALLQEKKLLNDIGNLPGLDKTVDKSAKALKSALNTINARLQAEKKASLDRLKMIDTEEKIERKEEAIKNRKLAFVQKVISQELALYRQLEVEKAKIMAKYGQLPASLQTLKAPMSPLYTDKGATNIRQENIPNYRQAMQDAKLFVVEQNKLKQQEAQRLATQRQQTAEANRQLSTARQQTKEMTKQNSLLTSFKKGIQKFGTDSFVFQRMFDSITRTLDEWSKMSIAMSQFRASANFENMNRQLDETVVRLGNVISKYEMIPAINKAKMLGMDFSGNKLSETLEMTTKVSQVFGMDATKAFGDFTVAISKASPIIMDNVGVLLRLEEAYKLFYDRQYKGKDSFDKWTESLSQAEKRTIYYKEAMRLLQEKTEGVAVKTNEVQSVLMKLKDAWYKLGTDLEDAGTLNPLIWALEKVVSLAEAVAATFMKISQGYKALQYDFPKIFGNPDVGFDAKDTQGLYNNRSRALQDIQATQNKEKELASKFLDEMNAMYAEKERRYDAMRNKTLIGATAKKRFADLEKELTQMSKAITDFENLTKNAKIGENILTSKEALNVYQYSKSLEDAMRYTATINKNFGAGNEAGFWNKENLNVYSNAVEQANKFTIDLAKSQKLSTFELGEYNTVQEQLKNNIKARYQDEKKMTDAQIKNLEKLRKEGALVALAQYGFVSGAGTEKDVQRKVETTQIRSAYDEKYQKTLQDSFNKMRELNDISIIELVDYNKRMQNSLDERLKTYTDSQKEILKADVDFRMQTTDSLKDRVVDALVLGETDKKRISDTRAWVEEQYKIWKDLSKSGSAVGLFNNFVNMLLQNQKTKKPERSKAPKEFWDKWYEMNRTAFTETLPEGITRDIEQARLDWYDQVKNLENLKKDIEQAKAAGRLDPEERKKFFGASGVDKTVFEGQMSMYRKTIEDNYRKMLDNLAEELKRKQEELNPFQQFVKDKFTEELTTRGDLLTKGGIIGSPQGNPNAVINKYKLYDVQSELNMLKVAEEKKKISNEYYETQKRIKTEIQAQYAIDVQKLQSEKEWTDTRDFHIRLSALQSEYAVKEKEAMDSLNSQYKERLGYTNSLLHNVDLLNSAIDYQLEQQRKITDEVYKQGDIVAKYNRENMKALSAMANKNMDITAYGFNAMGFGENEQSIAMKQANMQEKVYQQMASSNQFKSLAQKMMTVKTDTAFNFELDPTKQPLGMTDEEKSRLQQDAEVMKSIFQDVANSIIQSVTTASEVWKGMLQEMFSNVANFAGNMAWNAITGEDVSGVQALREARKTDLKDQQENLKNKSITQETYAKRAYEIEKTYIENKKAAEKNYRNEQWKQLGAVFWAQGMGYMIKGGIDMFAGNYAMGQAELTGGAALMALGAMLGYGRGGKKAMSKANMAEESKATKQDINVYVDNKIFEDKRQLKQAINNASV